MSQDPITVIAETVRDRFDTDFVGRFPEATDPAITAIANRVVTQLKHAAGQPHPSDVYEAAFEATKNRRPDLIDREPDGTEFIADPRWNAAWKAAFAAAIASAYPDKVSQAESEILRRDWDAALAIDG
jgi:hypothetical protein